MLLVLLCDLVTRGVDDRDRAGVPCEVLCSHATVATHGDGQIERDVSALLPSCALHQKPFTRGGKQGCPSKTFEASRA